MLLQGMKSSLTNPHKPLMNTMTPEHKEKRFILYTHDQIGKVTYGFAFWGGYALLVDGKWKFFES